MQSKAGRGSTAGVLKVILSCVTLRHMKTVTIRELHAKTGELVRQAQCHGEIWVTDNGRTIAKIIPMDATRKTTGGTDSTTIISEDREDRV
jgi:prevent-host-death family protein